MALFFHSAFTSKLSLKLNFFVNFSFLTWIIVSTDVWSGALMRLELTSTCIDFYRAKSGNIKYKKGNQNICAIMT